MRQQHLQGCFQSMHCEEDWYLCAEASLEVGDKVVGQRLCIVAIGLHKALEGHRPAVHAHAVKVRVSRRALRIKDGVSARQWCS